MRFLTHVAAGEFEGAQVFKLLSEFSSTLAIIRIAQVSFLIVESVTKECVGFPFVLVLVFLFRVALLVFLFVVFIATYIHDCHLVLSEDVIEFCVA